MANNPLGDIVGARFHEANLTQNASVASNGANAVLAYFGPFTNNIRIRDVFWMASGASNAATKTGSYRQLIVQDGGVAGTVTTTAKIVASVNLTATVAQFSTTNFTVNTAVTVPAGDILYISQSTVGGTDANGTVLVAGQFALDWEVI